MNIIDELVTETSEVAEDKSTLKSFKSNGVDPFKTKKISDVVKASEISEIILKELVNRVDECDSSFAKLVFLQTEEGLKDLQKKIKARESLEDGVGGFVRSDNFIKKYEPHEITEDEFQAVCDLVSDFEKITNSKLDNKYSKFLLFKNIKAQTAFKNGAGSFKRE